MITLLQGDYGTYVLVSDDGQELLVQCDYDRCGIASTFGWIPCPCGRTDGTVDCAHRTVVEMIGEATDWLDDRIGDTVDDPGYFQEDTP